MDNPKKEPALLRHKLETKLCLNCGFPNRESDKRCLYCKTSLLEETGLISWVRQTYYILRWRQQLKQRRDNVNDAPGNNLSSLSLLGYFILGAILSGAGFYLFASVSSPFCLSYMGFLSSGLYLQKNDLSSLPQKNTYRTV